MQLTINGTTETIAKETLTLAELLKLKNVAMPEMVSVELNGEIVERHQYERTEIKNNDVVEFLYFMGGGKCEI